MDNNNTNPNKDNGKILVATNLYTSQYEIGNITRLLIPVPPLPPPPPPPPAPPAPPAPPLPEEKMELVEDDKKEDPPQPGTSEKSARPPPLRPTVIQLARKNIIQTRTSLRALKRPGSDLTSYDTLIPEKVVVISSDDSSSSEDSFQIAIEGAYVNRYTAEIPDQQAKDDVVMECDPKDDPN